MNHSNKRVARVSRVSTNPKNKGFLEMNTLLEEVPPDVSSDDQQPESTGSFHRQIATEIIQHHKYVDRARRSLLPVSPASYTSSMELTPYSPATSASPTSYVDYKGNPVDSVAPFSLKTSTELLKVLNRIWRLEEHHATSKSLVKSLQSELGIAHKRIQELVREKQMDRQVIDDLMSQIDEERKLRKRSETLHRKLAKEMSKVKSSLSEAPEDLDKERRMRVLLEELCDEFAVGVREYEQRLRWLKHNVDHIEKDHRENVDDGGLLLLQMSEAWLDARLNMAQVKHGVRENVMIMDEIESFLKARRRSSFSDMIMEVGNGGCLESFRFDEPMMASTGVIPPNAEDEGEDEEENEDGDEDEDEDEDEDDDTHCFELSKNLVEEFSNRTHHVENIGESERHKLKDCEGSLDDVHNEERRVELNELVGGFEVGGAQSPIKLQLTRDNSKQRSVRNVEVGGPESPNKHTWEQKIVTRDVENLPLECSRRWSRGSRPKEYTLKDKLFEAQLEGRSSRYKCFYE